MYIEKKIGIERDVVLGWICFSTAIIFGFLFIKNIFDDKSFNYITSAILLIISYIAMWYSFSNVGYKWVKCEDYRIKKRWK